METAMTPTFRGEPISVSMKEATRLTNLSRATIDRLVADEKLPKFKIGKRVLFRYEDLRRIIDESPAKPK